MQLGTGCDRKAELAATGRNLQNREVNGRVEERKEDTMMDLGWDQP